MSSHAVPTVRIVSPVSAENPTGYIVINQSDFDHTKHDAWVEAEPEIAVEAESADAPAPAKRRAKAAE